MNSFLFIYYKSIIGLISSFIIFFHTHAQILFPNIILQKAKKLSGESIAKKINSYSKILLNIPYGTDKSSLTIVKNISNINKLEKYLSSPELHFSFKKFNCVTYVEIVLALSLSGPLNDINSATIKQFTENFIKYLKHIRYKNSENIFFHKNHFTSIDWIPNNKWLVKDVTQKIAYEQPKFAKCEINKKAWATSVEPIKTFFDTLPNHRIKMEQQKFTKLLKQQGINLNKKISIVPYIPIKDFIKHKKYFTQIFPKIAIINIVRPNWKIKQLIGTNINISHQGFAILKKGEIQFRHASSLGNTTTEVPLKNYLQRYLHSKTIKGINVLAINDLKKVH